MAPTGCVHDLVLNQTNHSKMQESELNHRHHLPLQSAQYLLQLQTQNHLKNHRYYVSDSKGFYRRPKHQVR
ncbi:Uncharacterised protein [Mycobacteroides abscessus subsp. abscessus]|nr:Uncharacterised protein [Mycobacteroides abscessus subsp. abscessus]